MENSVGNCFTVIHNYTPQGSQQVQRVSLLNGVMVYMAEETGESEKYPHLFWCISVSVNYGATSSLFFAFRRGDVFVGGARVYVICSCLLSCCVRGYCIAGGRRVTTGRVRICAWDKRGLCRNGIKV